MRIRWARDCHHFITVMPRPIELVVTTTGQPAPWADLRETLLEHRVNVARVLVFDGNRETTPVGLVRSARLELMPLGAPIGGGSRRHFCALNRERPESGPLEVVAFDLHHQVHAVDDRSILENTAAIPDMIASARAIAGGSSIAVSVLSMGLHGVVDPRLHQDIGAAWLVASLAGLARGGADSVTFDGSLLIGGGDSPSPLLIALHAALEFSGAEVLPTDEMADLAILRLRSGKLIRTLIANLSDRPLALPESIVGSRSRRRAISLQGDWLGVALADPLPGRSAGIIDEDGSS
ncbi:MAG: hypothetical protein H0W83_17115 [Planctomycetes bacterium]|nr:hypothetical protein [Planctomycetota bacterium]